MVGVLFHPSFSLANEESSSSPRSFLQSNILQSFPVFVPAPFLPATDADQPCLDEHDQVIIEDGVDQGVGQAVQGQHVVQHLKAGPCRV